MVYIVNFNVSRNLSDIKQYYDTYQGTNINFLLDDFNQGKTNWSIPKGALPGDEVIFMCAKTARTNLGLATSHIPDDYGSGFKAFVDQQKTAYKKYSGQLLGYGIVASNPVYDASDNRWYSDIDQLIQFTATIPYEEFKGFISISTMNSITHLKDEQWEHLKWIIHQKNPGIFPSAVSPDAEMLNNEFEDAVRKASKQSLDQLEKTAEKKSSKPEETIVQAKVFHRDPTIAAYVKKRANGICQLCGSPAPFTDQNGEPYLECHHIVWVSQGGMDSADNCVALCPNCHRKMHILNQARDIEVLKARNALNS